MFIRHRQAPTKHVTLLSRIVILSEAKDLCILPAVAKVHRCFASLSMTNS